LAFMLINSPVISVGTAAGLEIVRPRMRGFMVAALGFCSSVIGGGGGPLLIGAISDRLKPEFGEHSLRYGLVVLPVIVALGGIGYLLASRTAEADTARARGEAL